MDKPSPFRGRVHKDALPVVRVLVSSSGDLPEERNIVTALVEEFCRRESVCGTATRRCIGWDDQEAMIWPMIRGDPLDTIERVHRSLLRQLSDKQSGRFHLPPGWARG